MKYIKCSDDFQGKTWRLPRRQKTKQDKRKKEYTGPAGRETLKENKTSKTYIQMQSFILKINLG